MPRTIYHILFEKDFNDLPAEQINSKTTAGVTDTERRTKFFNEINTILSRRSKKKQHLLPSVILQLVRLRFPNELDKYMPPNSGIDVSIQDFVQWTKRAK